MSSQYSEALNGCIPMRNCLYFLPQIIQRFETTMPHVVFNIKFVYDESRVDQFLRGEQDILFARESEVKRFSSVQQDYLTATFISCCAKTTRWRSGRFLEILNESDLSEPLW